MFAVFEAVMAVGVAILIVGALIVAGLYALISTSEDPFP